MSFLVSDGTIGGLIPFGTAAFLGSFLLFTLELIVAKLLLPSFGGAAYVWTTSLMVFQGLLLAGYLYSDRALRRGRYGKAHLILLALPLLVFPIQVTVAATGAPITRLMAALLCAIGLPFFVLCTTSTVLQGWRRRLAPEDEAGTYSLYAASNAGSLAALVSYPFLIEPFLSVGTQLKAWMGLYLGFAALHAFLIPPAGPAERRAPSTTRLSDKISWVMLSLGPSAALLASTNFLTLDLAAVPLLWIVPLALYLSTFVATFKKDPWYPKRLSLVVVGAMVAWVVGILAAELYAVDLPDRWLLLRKLWVVNKSLFVCASLFLLCLICHRALAQARPKAEDSPRYYAAIALGGFLGSALVALGMPLVARRAAMPELDWALAGGLSLAALMFRGFTSGAREEARLPAPRATLAAVFLLGAAGLAFYVKQSPAFSSGVAFTLRNFYGYYRVVDKGGLRRFFHGNTLHGVQALDPARRREPLLYYDRRSPIGEALSLLGGEFPRVAVVGLGAGGLAAYGRPGQRWDFYELDPDVVMIARAYFTYLNDSAAKVTVVTGDARLSLEHAGAAYDLIVLDAFSGGAIPVHLLTREAFELYENRLTQRGLIAVHVTNRFLNLRPPLAAAARAQGLLGAARQTDFKRMVQEHYFSSWVILSRDPAMIQRLRGAGWESLDRQPTARVWTDGYVSLLRALRS